VNSELVKRQLVVQGRQHRLECLAQACRARLTQLEEQDQHLEEQAQAYAQRKDELGVQVIHLEAAGQTEKREYFPSKRGSWQRSGKCASAKPSWKSMQREAFAS